MPPKCCLPICWEACNHAVEEGMRAAIARIMERLILASTRICILAACCIVGRHSTKLFQSHWGILHNALRIGVLKPRCFRKVSVCGTRLFVSQPCLALLHLHQMHAVALCRRTICSSPSAGPTTSSRLPRMCGKMKFANVRYCLLCVALSTPLCFSLHLRVGGPSGNELGEQRLCKSVLILWWWWCVLLVLASRRQSARSR